MTDFLSRFVNYLSGEHLHTRETVSNGEINSLYGEKPSILKYLPWTDYDPKRMCFEFEDGVSVGAVLEVEPVDAEGRSQKYLYSVRSAIRDALHSVPEKDNNPWVMNVYSQDEDMRSIVDSLRSYVHPRAQGTKVSEDYLVEFEKHIQQVTQKGGLFEDNGSRWRGKERKVRMCIYRLCGNETWPNKNNMMPKDELDDVINRLISPLDAIGIKIKRMSGEQMRSWVLPWLNPKPISTGGNPYEYIKQNAYPVEEEENGQLPLGFDVAASCFIDSPESVDPEKGIWKFQDVFMKYISFGQLPQAPLMGHLGIEQDDGTPMGRPALLDMLPEGCVVACTITFINQFKLQRHIDEIAGSSAGEGPEAAQAVEQGENALDLISYGAKGLKMSAGVYIRGGSQIELNKANLKAIQLLTSYKLNPVEAEDDLVTQNSFVKMLPMAYDPKREDIEYRSFLTWSHHVANLMPFYGRGRGTGNPGFIFFNRSAEILTFDPFNSNDRKKAAHGLILGPTGAGKSALICYLVELWFAIMRPRLFLIESGGSFAPLAAHLERQGVSTNHVKLSVSNETGLSPFSDATKLYLSLEQEKIDKEKLSEFIEHSIDDTDEMSGLGSSEKPQKQSETWASSADISSDDDDDDEVERDILGEMEIAAMLMITGGETKEVEAFTRADRFMLREAIILAAKTVYEDYRDKKRSHKEVIVEDIVEALKQIHKDSTRPANRRDKAYTMAESLGLFTQGIEGRFFNRPGKAWPEVDATIVDLDRFARKNNEDKLAVVMTGLLNRINDMAEQYQHDGRPIIVLIDEAHIATTNPLLGPYIAVIGKMWRKLKTWLWLATQNMKDFPDQANKMLTMAEFWLCLTPPESEIEQISRFVSLSADQKKLLGQAKKAAKKYTEGVVISDTLVTLFRNVPPSRALALAMTEGDEKKWRADVKKELGTDDELEAIYEIANRLADARKPRAEDLNAQLADEILNPVRKLAVEIATEEKNALEAKKRLQTATKNEGSEEVA